MLLRQGGVSRERVNAQLPRRDTCAGKGVVASELSTSLHGLVKISLGGHGATRRGLAFAPSLVKTGVQVHSWGQTGSVKKLSGQGVER